MKTNAKFIISKSEAIKQFESIKNLGEISYSFKTNEPVGYILRDNTDCSFSIHAHSSIDKLKDSKRVWFFAQGWDLDEIEEIASKGVRRFVVDNVNDLNMLIDYINDKKLNIDLLLRMRLKEHTIHTGKHFVFGMYSHQVKELIPQLKANENILKLGIHFHRKTQNISEWSLKYELEGLFDKEFLESIDYVDIGGGIPGQYKNFRAEVIDNILNKIRELKEWLDEYNIKMIVEPGRYIAAPAVKLEAEIVNIYDHNIIINCSIFNGAMDTFVSHIRLKVDGEIEDRFAEGVGDYTVKGKTPDSMDIFRYKVTLKNPKVGDKMVFINAGAYIYSTDFCGLDAPLIEIVDSF